MNKKIVIGLILVIVAYAIYHKFYAKSPLLKLDGTPMLDANGNIIMTGNDHWFIG